MLYTLCRGIENRMPSTDTATSGNTDDSNRLSVENRPDSYMEKNSENKDVPKARNTSQGVKSRKKSMSGFR